MLASDQVFSRLLGRLYDAASEPTLWDSFIEELARCTEAKSAGLLIHDLEHAESSISSNWRFDPDLVRVYHQHYHVLDIWAQRGVVRPTGHVCTSESLCPLPEMRTTEIYNDFFVKADIEHGIFAILESSRRCLANISLFRDRSCPEFAEPELELLRFLAPHLQRAFKLHFHLLELKAHSAGIEAAMNLQATGIILLGCEGEILLMNRSAQTLLASRNGLIVE
jgi:hypothetical protein